MHFNIFVAIMTLLGSSHTIFGQIESIVYENHDDSIFIYRHDFGIRSDSVDRYFIEYHYQGETHRDQLMFMGDNSILGPDIISIIPIKFSGSLQPLFWIRYIHEYYGATSYVSSTNFSSTSDVIINPKKKTPLVSVLSSRKSEYIEHMGSRGSSLSLYRQDLEVDSSGTIYLGEIKIIENNYSSQIIRPVDDSLKNVEIETTVASDSIDYQFYQASPLKIVFYSSGSGGELKYFQNDTIVKTILIEDEK